MLIFVGGLIIAAAATIFLSRASIEATEEQSQVSILIDRLRELQIDENTDPTVKFVQFEKQVSIADEILEKELDKSQRRKAENAKLNALIQRELIWFDLDLEGIDNNFDLEKIGSILVESEETSTAGLAYLLLAVDGIRKFLNADSIDEQQHYRTSVENRIRNSIDFGDKYPDIAQQLLNILRSVAPKMSPGDSQFLFRTFVDAASRSSTVDIKLMSQEIRANLEDTASAFADVKRSYATNREAVIGTLLEQVEKALRDPNGVEDHVAKVIVERAEELLAVSRPDSAAQVLELLGQSAVAGNPQMISAMEQLSKKIDLFSNPFGLTGLVNLNDQRVEFENPNANFKLLFFTDTSSQAAGADKLIRMLNAIKSKILNQTVEFAVVAIHEKNNPADLADKQKFEKDNDNFHVWFLYKDSIAGQEFLKTCPINRSPFVVLLNPDSKVVSLGAPPRLLQDLVSE